MNGSQGRLEQQHPNNLDPNKNILYMNGTNSVNGNVVILDNEIGYIL